MLCAIAHIKGHKLESGDSFECIANSCIRTFSNFNALKRHMRKNHKVLESGQQNNLVANENDLLNNEIAVFGDHESHDDNDNDLDDSQGAQNCSITNSQQILGPTASVNSLHLLLKEQNDSAAYQISTLYSKPSATRDIVQSAVTVYNNTLACPKAEQLKNELNLIIEEANLSNEKLAKFNLILSKLIKPFEDLSTDSKRMAYFDNSGTMIPFNKVALGVANRIGYNGIERPTTFYGYYFDLATLLKSFLELPGVWAALKNHIQECEASVNSISFLQGDVWKEKKRLHPNKNLIPLSLYCDDFEPNNPLGSHSTVYKTGAIYITIPSMPKELKTLLDFIFAVGFHFADDRKVFGVKKTFEPVILMLLKLQNEGLILNLESIDVEVHFCLAYIHGDNLGLHEMLGFQGSFNSNKVCRFCVANKEQWQNMTQDNGSFLRNKQNYKTDLQINDPIKTGIKEECYFNNVGLNFHCTENYYVDLMHDFLEGVCKYDFKYILTNLIFIKKYFSLETLNYRLIYFSYNSHDRRNVPPPFSLDNIKNGKIRLSASEMLCFSRNFPLIIGDLIPKHNVCDAWKLYILMRKILYILLAGSWAPGVELKLRDLVDQHHTLFMRFAPNNRKLPPKFHFLTHYWRIAKQMGPPVHSWAMREEAKHKTSSSYCKASCNRMNLLYSIAWKHQMLMNEIMLKQKDFSSLISHVETTKKLSPLTNCITSLYDLPNDYVAKFATVRRVKISNESFQCKSVIAHGIDESDCLMFSLIEHVILRQEITPNKQRVEFLCRRLEFCYLDEHLDVYCVKDLKAAAKKAVVFPENVMWGRSFTLNILGGNTYVCLHAAVY